MKDKAIVCVEVLIIRLLCPRIDSNLIIIAKTTSCLGSRIDGSSVVSFFCNSYVLGLRGCSPADAKI
jgi:hypothetical protein